MWPPHANSLHGLLGFNSVEKTLSAHDRLVWAASSEKAAAKIPLSGLFSPCPKDCFYLCKWVSKIPFTPCPTQWRRHTPPWHRQQGQPGAKHSCLLMCGSFCLGIPAGSIPAALCRRKTAQKQLIQTINAGFPPKNIHLGMQEAGENGKVAALSPT